MQVSCIQEFHITDGVENETGPDSVGNTGHCMNIEIRNNWINQFLQDESDYNAFINHLQ